MLWRGAKSTLTHIRQRRSIDLVFVFIESVAFDRMRANYLDDDEYRELQEFLMLNPVAGVVVPGSGGVRKLRWARGGTGKRGGLRVILRARRTKRVLDADAVLEDEAGERACPHPEKTERSIRR